MARCSPYKFLLFLALSWPTVSSGGHLGDLKDWFSSVGKFGRDCAASWRAEGEEPLVREADCQEEGALYDYDLKVVLVVLYCVLVQHALDKATAVKSVYSLLLRCLKANLLRSTHVKEISCLFCSGIRVPVDPGCCPGGREALYSELLSITEQRGGGGQIK